MDTVTRTTKPTYNDLGSLLAMVTGDEKHSPASASTIDVLWVLYDRILRIDPDDPASPGRDRFYLSKGHGPAAFYAVLAAQGFIDHETLATLGTYGSPLGHHPDRTLIPGVEIASGSLGHGLPMAVGAAIGTRLRGSAVRVFCLIGDGELDEGSNHEAIALAGRLGLDQLTAIVIDNASSTHGWPGGIAERFTTEGWHGATIDGRDHAAIERALAHRSPDGPGVVVARVEPRG